MSHGLCFGEGAFARVPLWEADFPSKRQGEVLLDPPLQAYRLGSTNLMSIPMVLCVMGIMILTSQGCDGELKTWHIESFQ